MTMIDTDPRPEPPDDMTYEGPAYEQWVADLRAWNRREQRRQHNFDVYDAQLVGRCSQRRKVANNTYAERRGPDAIAIRLHDTDVVTYHRDGRIVLDTGGWYTVTTKDRINTFSPASVHSSRGRWFVTAGDGPSVGFADGMVIHPDGTITGGLDGERLRRAQDRDVNAKRKIAAFIKSITPEQVVKAFENPRGDPWCCSMRTADGQYPMGSDCIPKHVKSNYFTLALARRAVEHAGYGHPDVILSYIYHDAKRGRIDDSLTRSLKKLLDAHMREGVATR